MYRYLDLFPFSLIISQAGLELPVYLTRCLERMQKKAAEMAEATPTDAKGAG